MKGNHINLKPSMSNQIKTRFIWIFLIAILALILIPSGIALANNEATQNNGENPTNEISISGEITVYYELGKYLPSANIIGWDQNGNFYHDGPYAGTKTGARTASYNIPKIPSNITGLLEITCDQCKTEFKVLPNTSQTNVNFNLVTGVKGPITGPKYGPNDFDCYVFKAGSTYTDADGRSITLDKDLDLKINGVAYIPNAEFCFADGSHLVPDHKVGTLTYTYENGNEKINTIITCKGKNNKWFSNFIIKDRVRMFTYDVYRKNNPVPVYPVFTSEYTMAVTGNLRDGEDQSEEILKHDPYVYTAWYDLYTGKIGYSEGSVAPAESNPEGDFGFTDIPITAVGVVFAGATGYAMDCGYFYYSGDPKTQRVDLSVPKGAKVNIQYDEGFEKVVLAAGTQITFNGETEPITLEEDIDLGNKFPPFGLLLNTKITFNSDGTANYIYQPGTPEQHEVTYANCIFKAIPKEGYSFGSWEVNDVETTGEYVVKTKDDITIMPVINKIPGPQPEPDPEPTPAVNTTGAPATGDGTIPGIILAIITVSAFVAAQLYKRKQN